MLNYPAHRIRLFQIAVAWNVLPFMVPLAPIQVPTFSATDFSFATAAVASIVTVPVHVVTVKVLPEIAAIWPLMIVAAMSVIRCRI